MIDQPTYYLAVVLAVAVFVAASAQDLGDTGLPSIPDMVGSLVMIAIVGSPMLSPILVVCLAAGVIWARLVAAAAELAGIRVTSMASIPLAALWLLVGLTGAGWLALLLLFRSFSEGVD